MRYQRAELPLKLDGLEAARGFFAGCFANADPDVENLWVAHVDRQARCVHLSRHGGDSTSASFPLHSIIADAATHRSAGLVLAHNHPSGDLMPSSDDIRFTRKLIQLGRMMQISILDHLILGERGYISLEDLRMCGFISLRR